jgi:hypothetical protein
MPPLAGGARGPPQHRRPPSAPPPAKLGTAIAPPHLHGAHARLIRPRSVPLAGNVSTPPRPPPPLAAGHAPPLFLVHITYQQEPHVLYTMQDLFLPTKDLAAGENTPDRPAGHRRGLTGTHLQFTFLF